MFFGFLIILLILPIFDRHNKIGKFQTQKSLLVILWRSVADKIIPIVKTC